MICAGFLVTAATIAAQSETKSPATNGASCSVKLHYGKDVSLTLEAIQSLSSNAVQLVESSNFNSVSPPANSWQDYGVTKTQNAYRQTISGRHLLVSFRETRTIKTVGGALKVKEIVIGLSRDDFASPLHTIDDEGRIIGHGKYSGPLCVQFMGQVKKLTDSQD